MLLQLLGQLAQLGQLAPQPRVFVLRIQTRKQFKCIYRGCGFNGPLLGLLHPEGLLESDEFLLDLVNLGLHCSVGRREIVLEELRLVVALDGGEILR